MDTRIEFRFHGPHLPRAVRQELPQTLRDIEAAINEFLDAARDFTQYRSLDNAERVRVSSRLAWSLLLPNRHHFLQANREVVESFRESVVRLCESLGGEVYAQDDIFRHLVNSLERRKSLLDALLAENGEPRIRRLLAAERRTADRG